MNNEACRDREAELALRQVLDEVGGFEVRSRTSRRTGSAACDIVLVAAADETEIEIAVEARSRITPQTVLSLCEKMRELPADLVPVIYAPVISPRVAEIADARGVGYIDRAGNCRLRSARHRLLIERRGFKSSAGTSKGAANPFSPKSSRIVRALLSQPGKGWKVLELAKHPDVDVAAGLVSKVKRALVEEGYAVERENLLYLRDAVGLLRNWANAYPGPTEQIPMHFLGDAKAAERAVAEWCRDNHVPRALAGFSAAWRLAPEVRYSVAAVYVGSVGFDPKLLAALGSYQRGKPVETGANLLLWRPFDQSVFVDSQPAGPETLPVTSPLQTYLDLTKLPGRGEEAARAIYAKHLEPQLSNATEPVEETHHAGL